MADDSVPKYVDIEQVKTEGKGRLEIIWELLTSNMNWLQSNARRWSLNKRASPGMISDSLVRTADQMIDVYKEEAGGSRITPEQIAALMGGNGDEPD